MEMRSRSKAALTDCAYRAADRHPCSRANALRKTAEMSVTTDEAVAVANVDDVAVASLSPGEDHYPVAHRSHWSSHRRRIVGAFVLAPDAEHRMPAAAEDARDSAERDRSTQERRAERFA